MEQQSTGEMRWPVVGDALLSAREREVLALLARGLANQEIARALWIAETTVKGHVTHILRKLGVTNRTQAALYAIRAVVSGQWPVASPDGSLLTTNHSSRGTDL